ncbi:hypothetical protein PABG_12268 [Paracoccidioides brasiliensis Pb03]|uniref:Uncharacterized protein n=1 Tax=Paracoccidioides brasiliensis (strain Pb18) TaxID=502780 RepID=A0A0A0HUM1_PARBD|nr:uncharacterized protein PADG_12156 [Paracoccidioides brasiliensis Pb18]KGM91701.1 hypothetical protein PADG_12156 [Paracoccidioides brasiliensis Pb18]KGY14874.1 hypothetical protein PABG_12268 [Paracoccidioides brasiliensis Pb03]
MAMVRVWRDLCTRKDGRKEKEMQVKKLSGVSLTKALNIQSCSTN